MMSIEAISAIKRKNARRARLEGLEPYIAKHDGDEGVFKAPFLGGYRPAGWRITAKYFVDNSGFGAPDEPALTVNQFLSKVKEGRGYAIYEAGQF